jgi:hypothetical protein
MSCPDCTELATKIAEAKDAYHQLVLGKARASVTFGPSKRVEYTQANKADLKSYIAELEDQYALCCATSTTAKARGPVRFTF